MSLTSDQLAQLRNLANGGNFMALGIVDLLDSVSVGLKKAAKVASSSVNPASPGATIDGVTMVAGDRFLKISVPAVANNGLWQWNGAAVASTRPSDFNSPLEIADGTMIPVAQGTFAGRVFMITAPVAVLETTVITVESGSAFDDGRAPGLDPANYFVKFEDFELAAGGTLPAWLAKQDTSAAGTPTLDFVNDAAGGEYKMQHDNTNEVQNITLYGGDQRTFDLAKGPIFECRLKIDGTGGGPGLSIGNRIVFGLASDRAAVLDNVAINAWFRVEGDASTRKIEWETDDGTTDTDDQDTTKTYAEGTYLIARVDMTSLSAVKFYINDVLVGTGSMPLATGTVQPFIEVQKAANTNTDKVTIDWLKVRCAR